jgi:hypothetical protein
MAAANYRWGREMLTYFCFTLPYAGWPVGMMYLLHRFQIYPFTWPVVVADGGILSIAIGLNAAAVRRLIMSEHKWLELKIVLAGFATIAMTSASFFYGLRYFHGVINSVDFVHLALLVCIVSIVIGTFCRFFPEDNG